MPHFEMIFFSVKTEVNPITCTHVPISTSISVKTEVKFTFNAIILGFFFFYSSFAILQ